MARELCTSHASVTMRYEGQGHELPIPLSVAMRANSYSEASIRAEFERAYAAVFGRALPGLPLEAVTWRVQMTAPSATSGSVIRDASVSRGAAREGRRDVFYHERNGRVSADIYRWERLAPGDTLAGPAVFQSEDCTVVVGPSGRVTVDSFRNLVVEL